MPDELECVAKPSVMAAVWCIETLVLFFAVYMDQSTAGYVTSFTETLQFAVRFSN